MDYSDISWARPFMSSEETILWHGQPEKPRVLQKNDAYLIPFSILWFGFAVFWEYNVIKSKAPFFFPLFGAVFVILGLYYVFGRLIWRFYLLKKTKYVITSSKILRNRREKTDMLLLNDLPSFSVTTEEDGRGSILFHNPQPGYSSGWHVPMEDEKNTFSIISVPNVNRVVSIIQSAKES